MAREFTLPDVGEGVHEGELIEWLVEPGDAVSEDQPVAKVETDKALVDVPAPVDGSVRELRWSEGDVVPVGEVLLVFDVEGEVDDEALTAEPEPADPEGADPEPADRESADRESADAAGGEVDDSSGTDASASESGTAIDDRATDADDRGRVFAAPSARRLARELGVAIETVDGSGPGGRVSTEDVRAAAEADTTRESTSGAPQSTTDASASAADAPEPTTDTSAPTTDTSAPTTDESAAATGQVESATDAPRRRDADRDRTLATPSTRRVAIEEGIDIDAVPAVEERDGEAFVTEAAVREYADAQYDAQAADAEAVAAAGGEAPSSGSAESLERSSTTRSEATPADAEQRREPYRGVRRSIGEAMANSKFTAPHVTHHDEVDVTQLVETKARLSSRAEDRGVHLTYVPFVLKAVTAALREYPILNSYLDAEAEEIVYHDRYDLGVATATDAGLMVPVVEAVDEKGLFELAAEIEELTGRARDRSISPEELRGSTFTVTNVGAIGGEYATPILNHPEVGILALGQIRRKPRVVEDEDGTESIEPRSILPLSLSIDHRVVDGAEAAHFTNAVRERLRDPELLLLE